MSAASDQKLFCKLCSPFCCSFDDFVEEKVISPSYSSAILTPPVGSFLGEGANVWSDTCAINIFSQSVAYLFILLKLSFESV